MRQKPLDESLFNALIGAKACWNDRVRKPNDPVFYDEIEIFDVSCEEKNGKDPAVIAALNGVNIVLSSLFSRKVQGRDTSRPPNSQDHPIESKELPQIGAEVNEEDPKVVVPDGGFNFVFTLSNIQTRESSFLAGLKSS